MSDTTMPVSVDSRMPLFLKAIMHLTTPIGGTSHENIPTKCDHRHPAPTLDLLPESAHRTAYSLSPLVSLEGMFISLCSTGGGGVGGAPWVTGYAMTLPPSEPWTTPVMLNEQP